MGMPGSSPESRPLRASSSGFSLLEVVFAIGILAVAILGMAGVIVGGMRQLKSSPASVVAAQKAAQAVEAVFAARDSHTLPWDRVRNVDGESGDDGGVFLDGERPLTTAGADGLVNTADDPQTIETSVTPGADHIIGTADDGQQTLDGFTREIRIRDVPNEDGRLRSITVTITFPSGTTHETYTITTYISSYA